MDEVERAYQMLEVYGVSRKRAGSVAFWIDVLATRLQKEIAALNAMVASLRNPQQAQPAMAPCPHCNAKILSQWWIHCPMCGARIEPRQA